MKLCKEHRYVHMHTIDIIITVQYISHADNAYSTVIDTIPYYSSVEFDQLGSSRLGSQLLVRTRDDVVDNSTSTLPSALSLQLSHATQRYSLSLNWQTNQPLSVLQSIKNDV